MGMYANLKAIPREKLEEYFDNSYDDFEEDSLDEVSEEENDFENYPDCDLDKMWDILNFILTSPKNDTVNIKLLENVIYGQECYNPEVAEDGDLPTCFNNELITKSLAKELEKINFKNLLAKFKFQDFAQAELYPSIWDDEEDFEELTNDLCDYFHKLVNFYQQAAQHDYIVLSEIG